MPRITSVETSSKRSGERLIVYVDDELWGELDTGVAAEYRIYKGNHLSHNELKAAQEAGEHALALQRALNYLSYRARSVEEVRNRLQRYGHAEPTVTGVIERLVELGYLDDNTFARELVRQRAYKWGPRRITLELKLKGVDSVMAACAIQKEFASRSELETALTAAHKRYNNKDKSATMARRVYGFLMRRGYSVEVCTEVAREYRSS